MSKLELETLPLNKLIDPWILLRPVLRDSTDFLELKTSIDEIGLLNSIAVRPSPRSQVMSVIGEGIGPVNRLLYK